MNFRKSTKPIRMWIDGQSYNIKKLESKFSKQQNLSQSSKVEQQKERLFSTKFHLPSIYYMKLDRYRDPHMNILETETNTVITFPKEKEGILEIFGHSEESVEEAKEQIHSLVADIREKMSALQFISIPLLSDEIKSNFEQFKNIILSENHQGVEESIFQSALKLHITVVVFTLLDDVEKLEALNTLQECKHLFSRKDGQAAQIKIKVEGLNCMNDNLSKVNVLYANTCFTENSKTEKSLQEIVNAMSNLFYEKGLLKEYHDNVKLHMTLMNTKYRNKKEHSPNKRWIRRETFNATQIMGQYKNYYFGEAIFDTIHLSLMTSKGEDGFYTSLGSIQLFQ